MTNSALVVAPHGLDEVLGCGGTMAALAASGNRVQCVILFGDGTGRDGARRAASMAAAEALGVPGPTFAGFAENHGDGLRLGELVAAIESAVRLHDASTVFVPSGATLHVDHRRSYEAAVTALRPAPGSPVRRILAYEIVSSTDWAPALHWPAFRPTAFQEITAHVAQKARALECYGEEMRPEPHARSIAAVIRRSETWGASVGVAAAEAYEVVRESL